MTLGVTGAVSYGLGVAMTVGEAPSWAANVVYGTLGLCVLFGRELYFHRSKRGRHHLRRREYRKAMSDGAELLDWIGEKPANIDEGRAKAR